MFMDSSTTTGWDGDWKSVHQWVLSRFPSQIPGLERSIPWASGITISIGPRAETAAKVGDVIEFQESEEPTDFSTRVLRNVGEVLADRPEDTSTATIHLRATYSDEKPLDGSEMTFTRNFTRQARAVTPKRTLMTQIGSALEGAVSPAPHGPNGYQESPQALPSFTGPVGATLPFGEPERTYDPRPLPGGGMTDHAVFRVLGVLTAEIVSQRESNKLLTGQLVGVLSSVVESSSKDAERFGAEAAQGRQSINALERVLAETTKERDMLRERLEELQEEVEDLQEREDEPPPKKRKKKSSSNDAMDMFKAVVQQTVKKMTSGEEAPKEQAAPSAPVVKKRRRPPGAPSGQPRPARTPPPAEVTNGAATNVVGGLASMAGASPSQIAGVIAMLPEGMLDAITSELVEQNPGAAANLGDMIEKRSIEFIRKKKAERGLSLDDEEGEEEEGEEEEDPDTEDTGEEDLDDDSDDSEPDDEGADDDEE